jgi:hypothetical protein
MNNEYEMLRIMLLKKEVRLNICTPDKHVPEVERKV